MDTEDPLIEGTETVDSITEEHATNGSINEVTSPINQSTPEFSMNVTDYQLGAVIGFGSSAIVHMATYLPLNLQVAVKMIELDHFERNRIDELRKEIQVMALCKHPNLLGILTSFVSESKLWIVTPFLAGGSCLDVMKTGFRDGFEEFVIATILYQALQGLQYLHEHGHIHRDVKSGNLLMAEDGLVQLADFGVSASLADDGERRGVRKTYVGTPCWMAPEVMEITRGYDFKADIWSFGITALELAYGHAPYAKFPPMKVIYLTLSGKPPTLDRKQCARKYSRTFKDMIDLCLQRDPAKRPSARALLKHPFFKTAAKRPSFLVEAVLSHIPPVNLRDKTAQLRARGYPAAENKDEDENDNIKPKSPISESNQESWDFSLGEDDAEEEESEIEENDLVIKEEDESELLALEENEMTLPNRASRFIVAEEGEDMTAPTISVEDNQIDEALDEDLATRSTSPPSNNGVVESSAANVGPTEVKKGRFSVLEATPDEVSSEVEETGAGLVESGNEVMFEETSRFEVSAGNNSEPFKGFSERLSRPASTPGYHDYPAMNNSNIAVQPPGIHQQPHPTMQPLHTSMHQQHKLDTLLHMNEYIRAQLIELKQQQHHQETIQRPYQPGSPTTATSTTTPLSSFYPYPHAQMYHQVPPNAYYPPIPPLHPPLQQPPPMYPIPHHTMQSLPNFHHSASFSPSPSTANTLHHTHSSDPHYQASTSAASLGDSSTSVALSSILRELEAIRRENEILKANLRRD